MPNAAQIPFAEIRAWMFEAALPFWAESGRDRAHGGYLEELDLAGRPTEVGFKRVRAQCRQIYVFAHAALLGWEEGAAHSDLGYDYLLAKAWMGPDAGWAKTLTRQGAVLDAGPDLYDLAFVLFALGWRYRLTRDAEALARAHQTLDFIETKMRAPAGGFWHTLPAKGLRQQNPHMHLLEASLVLFEASGDGRFLEQARDLVGLFHESFFDGRTLGEFFNDDWTRADAAPGRIVEPGHHLEWAWILSQFQRLSGDDVGTAPQALVAFAEAHGIDRASGAVFNQVRDDGAPLDAGSRTWPNTERIKGHLARFEREGVDPRGPVAASARLLLDRYLSGAPRGAWRDAFDAHGAPVAAAIPASTLYHVFLAFAETLRLEPLLSR